MKRLGDFKLGIEGSEEGRWILIDYGDFVVHIFSAEARAYYHSKRSGATPPTSTGKTRPRPPEAAVAGTSRGRRGSSGSIRTGNRATMNVLERLRVAFAAATPEGADRAGVRRGRPPEHRPQVRRLPGQRLHGAGQGGREEPASLAQDVAARVDLDPVAGTPEVAGPGFLNVRLRDDWIAQALGDLLNDERLGLAHPVRPKTVVIDYSSPNVAKPMHVGHIRSTVIGESLARIFAALGHKVIRDNHLGDWGSQFGMILWGWKNRRDEAAYAADPVAELARLYRLAQDRIKAGDDDVEEAARAETAKLHAGDPENRALWEQFMPHCLGALDAIYERLGVRFDVELGESFYDPMLADVVKDLEAKGLAVDERRGHRRLRRGVQDPVHDPQERRRLQLRHDRPGDHPLPRRRPGTPTRSFTWSITARATTSSSSSPSPGRWGYDSVDLEHVAFGTILGDDRKPFKTREGDVVGLESLLDEAVAEARKVVEREQPRSRTRRAAARLRRSSASAPSSTPTSRRTGSATTCSTGKKCWP